MLRHSDVWRAVDRLAREYGLSASGLARRAGLDPTTFNKSKRTTREGKLRWPSTESVAKILDATGASLGEFVSYVGGDEGIGVYRNVPLIGLAQAAAGGCFDGAGRPDGEAWDEIPFPGLGDPHAYALEINGNGLEPVFRDGDIIIVSPGASIRRGDRVVVRTAAGKVLVMGLRRRTARKIDLQPFNPRRRERTLPIGDVEGIDRVVWVSQ